MQKYMSFYMNAAKPNIDVEKKSSTIFQLQFNIAIPIMHQKTNKQTNNNNNQEKNTHTHTHPPPPPTFSVCLFVIKNITKNI